MNQPPSLTGGPPHLMNNNVMMSDENMSYGMPGGGLTRLPPRPPGFDGMMGGMMQNPPSKYIGGYG